METSFDCFIEVTAKNVEEKARREDRLWGEKEERERRVYFFLSKAHCPPHMYRGFSRPNGKGMSTVNLASSHNP